MESKMQCLDQIKQENTEFLKEDDKSKVNPYAKERMLKEYEERTGKKGNKRNLSRIPLWYFLHEILGVERCKNVICWENVDEFVFTIKKPKELAILWGQIKNKTTMTYAKLARGIRYYYGKGVIEKYRGKRFSYQFIISKKTSAILLQNAPMHKTTEQKPSSLKRKYLAPGSKDPLSARALKRSRSTASSDSSDRMSIGSSEGSSDNESEYANLEELGNLDLCLKDIFSDEARMKELFTDVTIFDHESRRHRSDDAVNTSFDFDLDEFLTNERGYNNSSEQFVEMSNSPNLSDNYPDTSDSPPPLEHQLHAITNKERDTEILSEVKNNVNTLTLEDIRESLIMGQNYCTSTGNSHIRFYDGSNKLDNPLPQLDEPNLLGFRKPTYGRRKSRSESDIPRIMYNGQFPIKCEPIDSNIEYNVQPSMTQNVWVNMHPPTMILPNFTSYPVVNTPSNSLDLENLNYYDY